MLFKDSVKRVIGNICIMRWYSNLTIQKALAEQMENREVIWAQFPRSKDKPFWARRTHITGANSIDYWLNSLDYEYHSIGIFIGTNIFDWDAMDVTPPPFRTKGFGRKQFTNVWNQYLLPKGCEDRGLVWEDIWLGKSLLFDFDNAENPMVAFHRADKVAKYLTKVLKASCYMVFSGSKGFHVHVSPEDSLRLTGVNFADFKEMKDPLKKIGKIYANKVVEIADAAQVSYADEDRSSNFRQGIVRCPYSIHPKTGQIVWPLSSKNLNDLRELQEASVEEIANILHEWDIPCQSHIPDEGKITYITPEYRVTDRGLIKWN